MSVCMAVCSCAWMNCKCKSTVFKYCFRCCEDHGKTQVKHGETNLSTANGILRICSRSKMCYCISVATLLCIGPQQCCSNRLQSLQICHFIQIQRLNFIVAFYTNKPRRYTSKLSNIHEQTRTYNSSKNSNSLI